MYRLVPLSYEDIKPLELEYSKKAKDPDILEGDSIEFYGVFLNMDLIGYFGLQDLGEHVLFIRQGYVLPQYQHKKVWKESLELLEKTAKKAGYNAIQFETTRNAFAYARLFKSLDFKIHYAGFCKRI